MADSLYRRVTDLINSGLSKEDVRSRLINAGANPETVRAYLAEQVADNQSHAQWLTKAKRATLDHLLDLKRAGHSPTKTELFVPSDGPKRFGHVSAAPSASYIGSAASMCADSTI